MLEEIGKNCCNQDLQAVHAFCHQINRFLHASTISTQEKIHCTKFAVTAPPFPPPEAGQCHISSKSSREICWPRYEDLDTTCTDVGSNMVSAPAVRHAALVALLFLHP